MNMRTVKSPRFIYLRRGPRKIEPRHLLVNSAVIIFAVLLGDTAVCSATGTSSHKWTNSFGDNSNDAVIRTASLTNSWAVQLRGPSTAAAYAIATKYGLVNLGQIGNLQGYYHFHLTNITLNINTSHPVPAVPAVDDSLLAEDANTLHLFSSAAVQVLLHRLTSALSGDEIVGSVEQQQLISRYHRRHYAPPTDPKWSQQWSLRNVKQTVGPPKLDINVQPAWMQGFTGEGVVVSFIDDGLEWNHPDLSANYDTQASWDLVHHDDDPTPDSYNGKFPHHHGTNCAGEVGMAKSNGNCGVGVAYNAKIGGIKVQLNQMTDLMEAGALGYHDDHIDVYSSSWGPSDSGFVVSGPGGLAKMALRNGAERGRNGRGVIYVWAAGNGGLNYDSCAADGFSSSIFTISVGSADEYGRQADFDESCSSKMAVTYSYNSYTYPAPSDSWTAYRQVTTTSLNGECTDDFTGTSAAAPLAAGVVTLVLEANPTLTWRDIQYLFVYTSNPSNLVGGEWTRNGAGLNVSHKFGFGAIDAEAMVTRARRWTNVPPQLSETFQASPSLGTARRSQPLSITFNVSSNSSIRFLEHAVIVLSAEVKGYSESFDYSDYNAIDKSNDEHVNAWLENEHPRRGDIKVVLSSPQQTSSVLLPFRRHDFVNSEGYSHWPFMSVHYWGENPIGQWTLTVVFISSEGFVEVNGIGLELYGTQSTPEALRDIPTQCHPQCKTGCSGEGPQNCDVCRNLRVAATLECVTICPPGTAVSDDHYSYCLESNYTIELHGSSELAAKATDMTTTADSFEQSQRSLRHSTYLTVGVTTSIAVILLLTLAVLLCVLVYVSRSKCPYSNKYRIFTEEMTQSGLIGSSSLNLSMNTWHSDSSDELCSSLTPV